MDRNNKIVLTNEYQQEKKLNENTTKEDLDNQYIVDEHGNKFRVPYRMVKIVTFSNVKPVGEFRDQPHAARLQYRLMEKDAILKARVNFIKKTITLIYNPLEANNLKEKIDVKGIVDFLKSQNLEIDESMADDKDFDYIKDFYSYAFNPPSIREHPPYGYTHDEWQKMKAEYEKNRKKGEKEKWEKFLLWQKEYEKLHPEEKKWEDDSLINE